MIKPSRRLLLTQLMALTQTRIFTPQKTTGDIWRRFLPSEPFVKPGSRSSDLLGPRGGPPANAPSGAQSFALFDLFALGAHCGRAPAVPNNHLTETRRGLLDEDRRHTPT